MKIHNFANGIILISLFFGNLSFAQDVKVDWQKLLIEDAQSIHDELLDSHPGTYDNLNPKFLKTLDAGLLKAKARAKIVKDYGGYKWALREYVASFNDGHLGVGFNNNFKTDDKWPGFLVKYDGGKYIVGAGDKDDKSIPSNGAELISCDGKSAEKIAYERQGQFRGRWFLESQKADFADYIMGDFGNPFVKSPKSCIFKQDGKAKSYNLQWRIFGNDLLGKKLALLHPSTKLNFSQQVLPGGGVWFKWPAFDGNSDSEANKALKPMLEAVQKNPTELQNAKYIVFDVRGNGGGSSMWAYEFAYVVWGKDYVKEHSPSGVSSVDWRVSDKNIAALEEGLKDYQANNGSEEAIKWFEKSINGMKAAKAKGEKYFVDKDDEDDDKVANKNNATKLFNGNAFIVTDYTCASACLDAVDLYKSLGVKQIGTVTSADTLYMDVRQQQLPSGYANISIPMKVYRGRARGNNIPQMPDILIKDIANDTAILSAIQTYNSKAK